MIYYSTESISSKETCNTSKYEYSKEFRSEKTNSFLAQKKLALWIFCFLKIFQLSLGNHVTVENERDKVIDTNLEIFRLESLTSNVPHIGQKSIYPAVSQEGDKNIFVRVEVDLIITRHIATISDMCFFEVAEHIVGDAPDVVGDPS